MNVNKEVTDSKDLRSPSVSLKDINLRINRQFKKDIDQTVIVKALDENGEEVTLTGIDEMAKCFCHELDHLDGVCFVDKVTEWL